MLSDKTHAVFHSLNSGIAKPRFKFQALAICAALMTFASQGWGQTSYTMSSGNKTWDFAGIASWADNFATGTDAANWASVAIIGTGTSVTTGVRTTKSSAAFAASTTTGGLHKGTQAMQFLSTGSSGTPEAVAVDLLLDFTGRTAGTLSFDWAAIDNSSGTRPTSLRVFWSTDNSAFTEIAGAQVLDKVSASTGAISAVTLPTQFSGNATARLRFYNHAGGAAGTGARDKMQIDNVAVTSTPAATAPTAPTITAITPGNGQLSVAFTAGADGGSAITDYKWSIDGSNYTTRAGTTSPIVITGLTNGTAYTVRIRAVNAIGDGTVATAGSTATPRTTPAAPTLGTITPGNGQLSVAFTAGADGGSAITNYKYSINGGAIVTVGSTSSPFIITGLTNGQLYAIQLYAVNSAGDSLASSAVNGTPLAPSSPTITVAPTTFASAFTTTYGTASSTQTFAVSGSTLNSDLTVTAPAGLEISLSSGSGYADSLTLSQTSGAVSSTTIYARLKATAAAGSYNSATIGVSGGGATAQSVSTTATGNVVGQATLTITGIGIANKVYDRATSATITGTAAYGGLQNGESFGVTGTPSASFAIATVGLAKPVTVTGYSAPNSNYTLTQPTLAADITAVALTVTGATVTPKSYDGNTVATIAGATLSGVISPDVVTLTGGISGTFANANVATGIAVSTAMGITGADAGNYSLTVPTGLVGEITIATAVITFNSLPTGKKVGDVAFSAGATTTAGTLSYSSSNPNVATADGSGSITPVAPGVTTITASVAGTANYNAAAPVSQTLNVGGAAGSSTTILTENMGTPSGTTAITSHTFQNSATLSYSNGGQANPADVRVTSASSVYTGASGGGNVFFTSTSGAYGFSTENINAAGTSNLQLSYGYRKESSTVHASFSVDYWNGTAWVTVANTAGALFTEAANAAIGWYSAMPLSLPAGAQIEGLKIRFVKTGNASIRIDDVKLTSAPSIPAITATGSFASVSTAYGTASAASATTVAVTGGSLTAGIVATASTGFEVSNDGATYGATANFAQSGGFANGTLYLRLAANAAAGSRSGDVVLSSTGATSVNVPVVASTVTAKALTVAAVPKTKVYGETDPALTYTSDGLVNGDTLTGSLSRAVGTAVGTYAISQGTLANPNYNISFTGADFTITAASLASSAITLSPSGGSYTASGPVGSTFSYSYAGRSANGITTSYSSASAPTAAGYYTVTATATGNYSGSNTADYFVAGPVAVADSLTKPADNKPYTIPVSDLLGNDRRITSTGTIETTGLTATEVMAGAGSAARIINFFVQFTPSSETTDTFNYTVSDGTGSATATVTITTEAQAPSFTLQIVKAGAATFVGGNTTVTHDFIGVPNQTYLVEYTSDLAGAWTSAGNQSTGVTGSFSVTFTKSGDVAADWNAHMFFRARLVP